MVAIALRFLRVRRPVAFLLADEDNVDAEFLGMVGAQTQRLGCRICSRGAFIIGVLWPEPFAWPVELTAQMVLQKMSRDAGDQIGVGSPCEQIKHFGP